MTAHPNSPARQRCAWCPPADPLYVAYHDTEWGVPEHDGGRLFAMLNLEGAQAGLSWRTVLARRENYLRVFEGFDAKTLARWTDSQIAAALTEPGIIRNRLKVHAVIRNARAVQRHFGGQLDQFSEFLWSFVDHRPRQHGYAQSSEIPTFTADSQGMSRELRKRDFTFVGPTICQAFMQAVGMVNDHLVSCFRYAPVRTLGTKSVAGTAE